MERQQDLHTHVSKANNNNGTKAQSKSVDQLESESGSLVTAPQSSLSLEAHSTDSLNEQPKKNLLRKWHRKQTVRIGSGTRNFLTKLKSRTGTLDKSHSVENVAPRQDSSGTKLSAEILASEDSGVQEKPSTWSEHVWSTFIHRGYSDDVTEKQPLVNGKDLLTDFQQDKFKYFFYHVLDLNTDHVISKEDFIKLNKRIKHYMDWSVNTIQFLALQEVHGLFLDYFLHSSTLVTISQQNCAMEWDPYPQPPEEKCCVTIDEWLDVWGLLVGEAKKISDLPMWLQYYPKTLFDTINRSGSGIISKNELRLFFTAFLDVGTLGEEKIWSITEESYSAMTSNGDVNLDYHIYKLSFLNFLIGKQPNGPGQYIFGSVEPKNRVGLFSVDYTAITRQDSEEKETFSVETLFGFGERQRKSIIV